MTTFAINTGNKKSPIIMRGCATADEAAVFGEASDAKDYVTCSLAKLGDSFSLTELAAMFNSLPGEAKVERFADKTAAVRRITEKYAGCAEELDQKATGKKAKKAKKAKKERKLEGKVKVKAIKKEGARFQKESLRVKAHQWLADEGQMPVEDFITGIMKLLKIERNQALGVLRYLSAVEMVSVG